MGRLRFVLVAVIAIVGLALAGPSASGASGRDVEPTDVELGPAQRIFNSPSPDELFPGSDFERGPGKGKGKDKDKNDDEEEGGGSGGSGSGDGDQTEDCWAMDQSELNFAEKINNARTNHGRSRLDLDLELSRVANYHSWNMARFNRLYHTPEEKLRERVTNWAILGENVGRGGSVESLHDAFMDSPDHRDNVLYRPFKYVGIGVVEREDWMWVTILFEAYDNPGTTMTMPPPC